MSFWIFNFYMWFIIENRNFFLMILMHTKNDFCINAMIFRFIKDLITGIIIIFIYIPNWRVRFLIMIFIWLIIVKQILVIINSSQLVHHHNRRYMIHHDSLDDHLTFIKYKSWGLTHSNCRVKFSTCHKFWISGSRVSSWSPSSFFTLCLQSRSLQGGIVSKKGNKLSI